ncbi:hypothetical protein P692DRAFT_20840713 [Suillus brevipes Sb2]|nr:hypothetical protein P692DRAFT_20840713 [Suillus brevipes Sb2]
MQKEYSVFAEDFVTTFAPEIFEVYLHQVELYVQGTILCFGALGGIATAFIATLTPYLVSAP